MRTSSFLTGAVVAMALLVDFGPAAPPPAEQPLVFIVNKSNPIDDLSLAELRGIFLAERQSWPNRRKITVVMRERGDPGRLTLLWDVCRMSESDFSRHILHATFTGEVAAGPKLLATPAGVRRFVVNVPGAIGYVRADDLDDSVKPLRIDGRAPGDSGYPLKTKPQ